MSSKRLDNDVKKLEDAVAPLSTSENKNKI